MKKFSLLKKVGLSFLAVFVFLLLFEVFLFLVSPTNNANFGCRDIDDVENNSRVEAAIGLFDAGKKALLERNLDGALSKFLEATKADSGFSNAFLEAGKIQVIQGKYEDAEKSARAMLNDTDLSFKIMDYRAYLLLSNSLFYRAKIPKADFSNPEELKAAFNDYAAEIENLGARDYGTKAETICPNTYQTPLCIFREDDITDYSLIPNLRTFHVTKKYTYPVEINSVGIRDKEVSKEKAKNSVRVLFLGDSYVFGYGVHKKTIPDYLELELNSRSNEKNFEVINLGVPGFDLSQENLFFDRFSDYGADVVLIGANGTDLFSGEKIEDCSGVTKAGCLFNYASCVQKKEKAGLDNLLGFSRVYNFFRERINALEEQGKARAGWENAKKHLKELVGKIREKNAKPAIVFIPLSEIVSNRQASDEKYRLFEGFAKENNVPIIDPSYALVQKNKENKVFFEVFDTHTNEFGDETIAKEIATNWQKITK